MNRNWIIFLLLSAVGCGQGEQPEAASCYNATAPLVGKWILTEQRYYGGCCPVITDTTWKKADTNAELTVWVEFQANGIVKTNNGSGITSDVVETNYSFKNNEITLDQNIISGPAWAKTVPVRTLDDKELTFTVVVGKEGEKNDRKFKRSCQ